MDCGRVDRAQGWVRSASLLEWLKQDEIDNGGCTGITTAESQRVKELEREVKELRVPTRS